MGVHRILVINKLTEDFDGTSVILSVGIRDDSPWLEVYFKDFDFEWNYTRGFMYVVSQASSP